MVRTLVSWVAKSAAVLGVLLAFPISGYASATGGSIVQSNNEQFDEEQGGRAAPGSGNRPQSAGHGKIGQTLAELFASGGQAPAGGGKARGHFASNEGGKARVAGGRVLIDAVADRDALLLLIELQELGLTRGAVAGNIVSGWLPISALDQVNSASSLRFARPSVPITLGGSVTSQGDEAMLADLARASFAVDGSGVTIGVLSDTFNCLGGAPSDVASGDLPSGILVLDPGLCTASSVDEGRAMMQLIFDVAPGANFIFHSGFGGQADFALGIDELAAAGADVIVDDVLYFSEPMFQDGAIAQAVDRVVEAGVPYFAAAGNFGDRGYESQFLSGMSGSVFGHNYDFHNFDTGAAVDVLQRVTIPVGTGVRFVLQWDEPFFSVSGAPGSSNVVDLFISSDDGSTLLARTPLSGVLGGDPVDEVTFFNPGPATEFSVLIGHDLDEGGPPPGRVKYVMFGTGSIAEYETGGGTIYGHANAAGAQTVGAAYYQNTPAFGTSPAVLQDYSSVGTTRVLFDAAGARLGSPEIRQKPNIVGPDGGDTTFLGTDTDGNGFPNFFGTSAAAPHVSGVAALMLTLYPSLTPAQLYATLESTALDMGEPGVDVYTGHGLVQAEAALASLQVTDLTLDNIVSNTTPLVGDDVTFALTLTNEGGTAEATGVAVLDLLPSGLTYLNHTASVGSYEPVTGLWDIAALAQNGVATLNISANVTSTGAIMSTAEIVAADQADPDSTPNNGLATEDDQASVTLTASPATADLRLTNIVSNTTLLVGDDVTFALTLTNEGGTAEATGVAVLDLLPSGLTYLNHTASVGSYEPVTGLWDIAALAQNGVATLNISANVTSTGAIMSTAEIVAADQADPDSTPNNGLASEDDQASVTLTASPMAVHLITNVTAASGNAYERHKIAEGDAVYTDSTKVFTNVPLTLDGHEYVRTANSDKDAIDAAFVSFSLTSEADVYVLYDDRATRLPAWLDDGTWTSSGMRVDIKGGRLLAYLKHFPAGPVQLGGNAMAPMQRARVNYSIVAIPYVAGDVSPSVGITSPEHGSSTGSGLAILFVGTSEDAEDGDLTESIVWKSDIDGLLGIGGTFARSLADGTHTITAEVADSAGQIATSSVVVIVGPPPSGGRLSVASMDYFTVGGKFSDKHLQVTISIADDSGGPAAGASVSLHILLNDGVVGSFMGTTTVEGTAEFGIKNASPGCYSIEVVDISTGAASWDGVTPDNVFCKP